MSVKKLTSMTARTQASSQPKAPDVPGMPDALFECSMPFNVIRARRLELIDRTGETRCLLQVDDQGVPSFGFPYRKGTRAYALISLAALAAFMRSMGARNRRSRARKTTPGRGKAGRKAA